MYAISIDKQTINQMPVVTFPGRIHVIYADSQVKSAVMALRSAHIVGFDTETRPSFKRGEHHKVALLQLSGPDHAFLFRTQKFGMPKGLCKVMASRDILKIGAAVRDDVRGLQRFNRFEPHGYVDLQCIAWEWGIKDKSVKKLAANILGLKVSKAQQLSNWEAETLTPAQQMYSATDAWVCLEMYRKLLATPKSPLGVQNLEVVGQ